MRYQSHVGKATNPAVHINVDRYAHQKSQQCPNDMMQSIHSPFSPDVDTTCSEMPKYLINKKRCVPTYLPMSHFRSQLGNRISDARLKD